MTDQTFEAQRFAETLARANAEMEQYGKLTQGTQNDVKDASMKAKFGLSNFSAATDSGAAAIVQLGKAAIVYSKAMLDGKRGASAANGALDELSTAVTLAATGLALLYPPIGLVVGALAFFTKASIEAAKAANELKDKMHKGYQELSEAGGAAADGMTGLFEDAKKLGLAMSDVGQYTALVTANAKDLALFSGTVFQGRQTFADVVKGMDQYKMGLMNLGLTQEQINAGAMGYLKLQSRIGLSQNQTTAQLADGAKKYLFEMDALSKITGETRKGMEDTMEAARSEERFAAKLQELRASGRAEEAKQLEITNVMLAAVSKEAAQGFRDLSTGMITTDAAQKLYLSTQGKALEEADKLSKGQTTAAGAAGVIATAAGETATKLTALGKMGVFGESFISYSESLRLGIFAQNDLTKAQKKAEEQIDKQAKGADAMTASMSALIIKQQQENAAAERAIMGFDGMSDIMGHLSIAISDLLGMIKKVFGYLAGAMGEFFDLKGGPGKALGSGGAKSPEGTFLNSSAAATTQQAKAVKGVTRESEMMPASADQSVPPRPSDLMKAQVWDSRYGRAWNPDGTPKTAQQKAAPKPPAPAPVAAAAPPAPAPAPAAAKAAAAPAAVKAAAPAATRSVAAAPASGGGGGGGGGGGVDGAPSESVPPAAPGATGKEETGGGRGGQGGASLSEVQMGDSVVVGDKVRKGGTVSWRTNNPGNNSYSDLAKKFGAIGTWKKLDGDAQQRSTGIAIMPSLDAGDALKMAQWRRPMYMGLDIDHGVSQWTNGNKDKNLGTAYAKDLAKAAGVPIETLIKDLTDDELKKMITKQRVWEGFKEGKVVSAADGGMFGGPKSGYPATLHGTEAVIPLKEGAVPVSLNAGKVFSNLTNEITNIVKEIAEQSVTNNATTVKLVADEFKSALSQMNQTKTDQSNSGMTEMLGMLSELVAAAKSGNDISSKILRSAN